uniref:Uncharacterized protein n=1 Tax=Oryza punctata TaxID=4537 RepID=A0A0E0K0U2_ORYPU
MAAAAALCGVALLLLLAIEVHGGGYGEEEEKVPLSAVIVPDPSPELREPTPVLSPSPSLAPAPPPVSGAGGSAGGGDDDMRPSAAVVPNSAPGQSGGTAFIRSSPAVPVPRGVTDTATILPMPTPGDKHQKVGAAAASARAGIAPIVVGLITMMASFWALH